MSTFATELLFQGFVTKSPPFLFYWIFPAPLSLSSRLLEIKMSLAAFDRPHPGLGSARPPGARTRERRLGGGGGGGSRPATRSASSGPTREASVNLDVQNRDGWAEIQRPELAIARAHITDGGELVVARELVGTGQPSGHDRRLGSEGAEEKKSRNQKALAEFMAAPPRVQNIRSIKARRPALKVSGDAPSPSLSQGAALPSTRLHVTVLDETNADELDHGDLTPLLSQEVAIPSTKLHVTVLDETNVNELDNEDLTIVLLDRLHVQRLESQSPTLSNRPLNLTPMRDGYEYYDPVYKSLGGTIQESTLRLCSGGKSVGTKRTGFRSAEKRIKKGRGRGSSRRQRRAAPVKSSRPGRQRKKPWCPPGVRVEVAAAPALPPRPPCIAPPDRTHHLSASDVHPKYGTTSENGDYEHRDEESGSESEFVDVCDCTVPGVSNGSPNS